MTIKINIKPIYYRAANNLCFINENFLHILVTFKAYDDNLLHKGGREISFLYKSKKTFLLNYILIVITNNIENYVISMCLYLLKKKKK